MGSALTAAFAGVLAVMVIAGGACSDGSSTVPEDAPLVPMPIPSPLSPDDPIAPVMVDHLALDARKVALGKRLFFDPILARDRDITCAYCHPFASGGTDGTTTSQLPGKEAMPVNTPTILNVGFNYKLHWNGKYDTLEAQLETPITSPRVMNNTFEEIVRRLRADKDYRASFERIYSDGVTEPALREVIATYERSLVTPNARFDQYLAGQQDALDAREKEGYTLFKDLGCISCHQGVNVGGNVMQRFGALKDYFAGREPKEADLGLYLVTQREEDKYVFRVPSLRNVARTAPYFHDGSAKTLEQAVQVMAEYQLGRALTEQQTGSIVAFLGTLTGETEGLD